MGRRSTLLIVIGLLIAVGPVLVAGLGALLVKAYGRSGFAELLQWSLLLLIVSIPLGAAMVVAGGAAKVAGHRALREAGLAGTTAEVRLRDWLPYLLLGGFFVAAPFVLGFDVGDRKLTREEVWRLGFAHFYVASGVGLVILAIFMRRGARWVRWPVALWCPLTMFGGLLWGLVQGVGRVQPYDFAVGLIISIAWIWIHLRGLSVKIRA